MEEATDQTGGRVVAKFEKNLSQIRKSPSQKGGRDILEARRATCGCSRFRSAPLQKDAGELLQVSGKLQQIQ